MGEWDDGNGMIVDMDYATHRTTRPRYRNSDGKNSLPPLAAMEILGESLSLSDTPIYSLLLFRRLGSESPD